MHAVRHMHNKGFQMIGFVWSIGGSEVHLRTLETLKGEASGEGLEETAALSGVNVARWARKFLLDDVMKASTARANLPQR